MQQMVSKVRVCLRFLYFLEALRRWIACGILRLSLWNSLVKLVWPGVFTARPDASPSLRHSRATTSPGQPFVFRATDSDFRIH